MAKASRPVHHSPCRDSKGLAVCPRPVSQGRMRSARPSGRGVNVAHLEASPPGRLLVSILTGNLGDHPACGKEARPGGGPDSPKQELQDSTSGRKGSTLLGNPRVAPGSAPQGREGAGGWGGSQGGSWPALTCILQSICYLHCELPGPRGQLLAPANSARGLGSGPRQALPPAGTTASPPASVGPACPKYRSACCYSLGEQAFGCPSL